MTARLAQSGFAHRTKHYRLSLTLAYVNSSTEMAFFLASFDAHHHSGLSYLTPADVHYGRAATILEVRHRTRLAAYAAHPERFVKGPPRLEALPEAVWINPSTNTTRQDAPATTIVSPLPSCERRTSNWAAGTVQFCRPIPPWLGTCANRHPGCPGKSR